jgi:hypothetical protein
LQNSPNQITTTPITYTKSIKQIAPRLNTPSKTLVQISVKYNGQYCLDHPSLSPMRPRRPSLSLAPPPMLTPLILSSRDQSVSTYYMLVCIENYFSYCWTRYYLHLGKNLVLEIDHGNCWRCSRGTVDTFLEAPITQKNQRRCSLVRRRRSAAQSRTVRGLTRGGGALWSDADGLRHRARRSATWCRS